MMFETYVTAEELSQRLEDRAWVLVDCRAVLGSPTQGEDMFRRGHLPGAGYADLNRDLSGPIEPGKTGRHPLPSREALVDALERLGISNSSQVVAYDLEFGQMAAARFWWLMKWAGHHAVAVLDGGYARWTDLGFPTESAEAHPDRGTFKPAFQDNLSVDAELVESSLGTGSLTLVDSRGEDRFRGENETVDPVAGHIPGAVSLPFAGNGSGGVIRSPEALKKRFQDALGSTQTDRVAFYCGSGVTAALNVLAYRHAGLGMPRLYAGSWSEWIVDPKRLLLVE